MSDPTPRADWIAKLLATLPRENVILLSYLLIFLKMVSSFSESNKMTNANLAMIFGPNLIRSREESSETSLMNASMATPILTLMMERYSECFKDVQID